jgi:hypothetical protein
MRTLRTEFYSLWKDDICHQYEYSAPIGGRLPGSASTTEPSAKGDIPEPGVARTRTESPPAGKKENQNRNHFVVEIPHAFDERIVQGAVFMCPCTLGMSREPEKFPATECFSGNFMPQESNGESLDSCRDRRRSCRPYAPREERSAAARASVQRSTSRSCSASTITRATGSVPE